MHLVILLLSLIPVLTYAQSIQTCSNAPMRPHCARYCSSSCGNAVYNCFDGKTQVLLNCGDCEYVDGRTEAACDVREAERGEVGR